MSKRIRAGRGHVIQRMVQKARILELHRARASWDTHNKEQVLEEISTLTNFPDHPVARMASAVTKIITLRVVIGIDISMVNIIPAKMIITQDTARDKAVACLRQVTIIGAISLILMLEVSIITLVPITLDGTTQIGQALAECNQTMVSSDGEVRIQEIAVNPGNIMSDLMTNFA